MNFLNIGPSELMVIVLIAILVVGPKRLAQAIQAIGRVSRKMRRLSGEFVGAIRSEIDTTENDLKQVVAEAQGTTDGSEGVVGELTEAKQETDQSLKSLVEGNFGLSSITKDIRAVQRETQGMMQDMLGEVMSMADMNQKTDKGSVPRETEQPQQQTVPPAQVQTTTDHIAAETTPKITAAVVVDQAEQLVAMESDAQDLSAAELPSNFSQTQEADTPIPSETESAEETVAVTTSTQEIVEPEDVKTQDTPKVSES